MNEENILQKLHKIINSSHIVTSDLSISDFMHFIVGYKAQKRNNSKEMPDIDTFSTAHLHNLYNMKKQLSTKELQHLCRGKTWTLETLIDSCNTLKNTYNKKAFPILIKNCCTLLTQYSPICDEEQNFSNIIRSLVFLHFFGTLTPFFPNFPNLCQKYVTWNEMENKIQKNLETNHLIFLTGNPGSGKKQLLIHALKASYCSIGKDYYWLNTNSSIPLEEEMTSLVFSGIQKNITEDEVLNILRAKTKNSLLVIHRPILTEEDLSFIRDILIPMNLYIIISTYTKVSLKDIPALDADNRPIDNLFNIFKVYSPSYVFTEEEFRLLANHFSDNVYMISIIAKALSSKSKILQKEQLINQVESFYYERKLPKVHSFYHMDDIERSSKSSQQLLFLVRKILSCYPNELFNNELSELSIWTKAPIPYRQLSKHFKEEMLHIWINAGILQYYDENKVYMPALIADIIWNEYPINFTEYSDKLLQFMSQIECGVFLPLPYETLYQVISNLIFRFHFQITIMPSRINQESKNLFLNWNNLLTNVIEHYMHLGNYIYAQKILPHLYIAYNKHRKIIEQPNDIFFSFIRKLLLLQSDYMQSSDIVTSLDKLIDLIKKIHNQFSEMDISIQFIVKDLIIYILKDISDSTVELLLQYTVKKLILPDTLAHLGNCLYTLEKCTFTFKALGMNERYYYEAICSSFSFLCNEPYTLKYINGNFQQFLHLEIQAEPRFKAHCIQFYFKILSAIQLTPIPYSELIKNFELLYSEFKNKIWSYHTSYIFYACVSLLVSCIPHCISDDFWNMLKRCIEQCRLFYNNQLSLSPNQMGVFNELLDSIFSKCP